MVLALVGCFSLLAGVKLVEQVSSSVYSDQQISVFIGVFYERVIQHL